MLRLFSYKMKGDSGFAPNPFWGMLTLATCKPCIRLKKGRGDWIAGFTSKDLCGDPVGKERLIYLMEVTDKKSLYEYFKSDDFCNKKPFNKCQHVCKVGDNIYRPTCANASAPEDFERLPEALYHCEKDDKQHDLSGESVLISSNFFYFGGKALSLPDEVRPNVPKGQSPHGSRTYDETRARNFIDYVSQREIGIHSAPHDWPSGDSSWSLQCREIITCQKPEGSQEKPT